MALHIRVASPLASAADLQSVLRNNRASVPTITSSSRNASSVSLVQQQYKQDDAYVDGEADHLGLPLDHSPPQTPTAGLTRVRSATLCTDTARNMSSTSLSGLCLAGPHREMSRDRSMDKLAGAVAGHHHHHQHHPQMHVHASAAGPAAHSSASGSSRGDTPVHMEPATWIVPHPVHLPPTAYAVSAGVADHTSVGGGAYRHGHGVMGLVGTGAVAAAEHVAIDVPMAVARGPTLSVGAVPIGNHSYAWLTHGAAQRLRSSSAAVPPPAGLGFPVVGTATALASTTPIVIVNPLARPTTTTTSSSGLRPSHSHSSSINGLSRLAVELDLPVNGVRYEECVICRVPGICDDMDRCCKMPRHVACEMANQRANPQKWTFDEGRGMLHLPCSACRQTWKSLAVADPLVTEVVTKLVADQAAATAERRRTIEQELNTSPTEIRNRNRRRVRVAVPASILGFSIVLLALIMGGKGAVSISVALGVAALAAVLTPVGSIWLLERVHTAMLMGVAEELAGMQTALPEWVPRALRAAKAAGKLGALTGTATVGRMVPPSPTLMPAPP